MANAVNPGGIGTGLRRNFTQRQRESLDAAEAAGVFTYKTDRARGGDHTGGSRRPGIRANRRSCLDDCREAYTVPNDADLAAHGHGVKQWALDPDAAGELWAVSLATLGAVNTDPDRL